MLDEAIDSTVLSEGDREAGPADDVLLRKIATGNREAFTVFLRRHLAPIVAFARRYVREISDAEDIAQETFSRVWTHAGRWREMGVAPRSWLYRIAYNLCIDELRKKRVVVDEFELVNDKTPEHELAQALNEDKVRRAIHALPERQRSALWLNVYHGISNREAAAIMDTTVEAMESLLTRARRTLRETLDLDG